MLTYSGIAKNSGQPMMTDLWDLFTQQTQRMSNSLNFVKSFEKMYEVYGIVTQDPEYKQYRHEKAMAQFAEQQEKQSIEERRHQLQQERARLEKEQDESTEVILDRKVH